MWQTWLDLLQPAHEAIALDRGYFSQPHGHTGDSTPESEPHFLDTGPRKFRITVGHSFGVHLLPHDLLSTSDLFVIISGFDKFIGERDTLLRRSYRQMKARLSSDPLAVIKDFHIACAQSDQVFSNHQPQTNLELLEADLDRLGKSNLLPLPDNLNGSSTKTSRLPASILILHGRNDTIVHLAKAEELHERLSLSVLKVHDTANHALPFMEAAWCLQQIEEHIRERSPIRAGANGSGGNRAERK